MPLMVYVSVSLLLFINTVPGGFHLGILPPAGLRDTAGLDVGAMEDEGGLLGAGLTVGGPLCGVEAAVKQSNCHYIPCEPSIIGIKAKSRFV